MTQHLMMGKTNKVHTHEAKPQVEEGIVKPDLSYKKDHEKLIDMEEEFMETRYHF
ncbi:MAG: hypothetical protein KDD45_18110 [Bdellovibrionales bacterium]|nr:hypothetical protein [Bdellovibrionales bacterium]